MAVLPPASDVIALTDTTLAEAVVDALIADALLIVGECTKVLDADRETAIIKWVAAHLVSNTTTGSNSALTSQSLGDASESYARAPMGKSLEGSIFGQQAIALDPNGCLRRIGRPAVGFEKI